MTVDAVNRAATVSTITWGHALTIIWIMAAAIMVAGILIIVGRSNMDKQPAASLVRSWIAVSLVIGLLIFTVVSMTLSDPTVRSTLIGAVSANVGAAVAFYFASKGSDQARQDILDATFGVEQVPTLKGMNVDAARSALGGTSLKLEIDPASPQGANFVAKQEPLQNTSVRKGSTVVVTLAADPPTG